MQRIPDSPFINGNPATSTQGTIVTADWLNAIQEELAGIVEKSGIVLDPENSAQVWDALRRSVPAAAVAQFAMATPPAGWLKANGALVSRTVYADLFAAIGTVYGAGDGTTTFALPDHRGYFLRGWDDGRGVDPGRALGSAQTDDLKAHSHSGVAQTGHLFNSGTTYTAYDLFTGQTGATGGTETRPKNMAVLICIKY
jgi:microcystin-dependent protein